MAFKGIVYAILFFLELAALAAVSYWGFHVDGTKIVTLFLGVGAPVAVAIFWGIFVAPKAKVQVSRPVRIMLQIVVFGLATIALYSSSQHTFAYVFAIVTIIELFLVHGVFERQTT